MVTACQNQTHPLSRGLLLHKAATKPILSSLAEVFSHHAWHLFQACPLFGIGYSKAFRVPLNLLRTPPKGTLHGVMVYWYCPGSAMISFVWFWFMRGLAVQAFGQRAKDQDAANKLKRKGMLFPGLPLCQQHGVHVTGF